MPKKDAQSWTFLSNHTHVLVCLERNNADLVRNLADKIGITERAVLRILGELASAGYIKVEKIGRRNEYSIIKNRSLRHPLEEKCQLGEMLKLLK
jgi:DNA-binding MarR family transcriptional regulator